MMPDEYKIAEACLICRQVLRRIAFELRKGSKGM